MLVELFVIGVKGHDVVECGERLVYPASIVRPLGLAGQTQGCVGRLRGKVLSNTVGPHVVTSMGERSSVMAKRLAHGGQARILPVG
ncbi:hypothetical protein OK074_1645 [Actinobacteria bacterium OK074]|nr:hypothetical protein OK074_1645 [Actinobacteria bacterium OK074]